MKTWITYKKRSSENYKFSTDDRSHPLIDDLKTHLKERNKWVRKHKEYVRIRPRGPRDGDTRDTPLKNATHFDVYVRSKYAY